MSLKGFRDEAHYRSVMKETLDRVEKAFDQVDPDVAECTVQFGALTIQFPNGARCILSSQPSVAQLWMAIAARGVAYHFNYDHDKKAWMDDKGEGIEAISFLEKFLLEAVKLTIRF